MNSRLRLIVAVGAVILALIILIWLLSSGSSDSEMARDAEMLETTTESDSMMGMEDDDMSADSGQADATGYSSDDYSSSTTDDSNWQDAADASEYERDRSSDMDGDSQAEQAQADAMMEEEPVAEELDAEVVEPNPLEDMPPPEEDMAAAEETPVEEELESQQDQFASGSSLRVQAFMSTGNITPRVCLFFNSRMPATNQFDYARHILVNSENDINYQRISASQVCMTGFLANQAYKVTLLSGLTSRSGKSLEGIRSYPDVYFNRFAHVGNEAVTDESNSQKMCFFFSEQLGAAQNYSSGGVGGINLTPSDPYQLESQGNRMCIRGLNAYKRYRVDFPAAMRSASGAKLTVSSDVLFELKHNQGRVGFEDEIIMIARGASPALEIHTANVDTLKGYIFKLADTTQVASLGTVKALTKDKIMSELQSISRESNDLVWEGEVKVEAAQSELVKTRFSITDIVSRHKPAVYAAMFSSVDIPLEGVLAGWENWGSGVGVKWFIYSGLNVGLNYSNRGVLISVNENKSNNPIPKAEIRLHGQNNKRSVLYQTNEQGMVTITRAVLESFGEETEVLMMVVSPDERYDVRAFNVREYLNQTL